MSAKCRNCFEPVEFVAGRWLHPHSGDIKCWTGDGAMAESDWWPEGTLRGAYDDRHDRIVCPVCDWYEWGGPTACGWAYHDHMNDAHQPANIDG